MAKKKTTKKTVKKPTPRKAAAAPAKKSSAKQKPSKKAPSKKAPAKKAPSKKAPSKKAVTKKAPTKKPAAAAKTSGKPATNKKPVSSKKATPPPAPLSEAMQLEQEMDKEWSIAQLRKVKTGLTKKDLEYFLQLLLEKRSEIIGNVQGMEDARNASLGDIAHMPLHMADVGSDNFEQEFTLGLMESERQMLREIEDAIKRIREGYYGVCMDSGRPINRARLEIKPWAKYCIEVARLREKRGW